MAETQNTNRTGAGYKPAYEGKAREKLTEPAGKRKGIPLRSPKYDVTHHSTDIKNNFEELEGKEVSIAGRVNVQTCYG